MFGRKKKREKQNELEQRIKDLELESVGLCEWTDEITNLLNKILPRIALVEDLTQAIAFLLSQKMKTPKKERKTTKKRKK